MPTRPNPNSARGVSGRCIGSAIDIKPFDGAATSLAPTPSNG